MYESQQDLGVTALSFEYKSGAIETMHHHSVGQLVYALTGVIHVITDTEIWLLPPNSALWIPPQTSHELHMIGNVSLRSLYIEPNVIPSNLSQLKLFKMSPLLKELILELIYSFHDIDNQKLIIPLLLKTLNTRLIFEGCSLPLPKDKKVLYVCESLLKHPSNTASIEVWADKIGVSSRTLIRHFKKETGLSFTQWRQQIRVGAAIKMLMDGNNIDEISRELGYSTSNAFSTMFKRIMGNSPSQFFR